MPSVFTKSTYIYLHKRKISMLTTTLFIYCLNAVHTFLFVCLYVEIIINNRKQ